MLFASSSTASLNPVTVCSTPTYNRNSKDIPCRVTLNVNTRVTLFQTPRPSSAALCTGGHAGRVAWRRVRCSLAINTRAPSFRRRRCATTSNKETSKDLV